MTHDLAAGHGAAVLLVDTALGHARAIVVPEEERQSFCKRRGELRWVLTLVVDMDVRLARVARVPAAPEELSLVHGVTRTDGDAAGHEVRDVEVRLDDEVVRPTLRGCEDVVVRREPVAAPGDAEDLIGREPYGGGRSDRPDRRWVGD